MLQSLLAEFDHEMDVTRRVLERIPDDALDWAPHARSFSLGQLAAHLANIPSWVGVTLDRRELDLDAPLETPPSGPRAVILSVFDGHVKSAREKLARATPSSLEEPWTLRSGAQGLFTLPRAAVLRSFVLNHMIHHRGQLTVYLRLRDVPVPSVYGPTADETAFAR